MLNPVGEILILAYRKRRDDVARRASAHRGTRRVPRAHDARGGPSVYDTGSSPGFITEILPFALLSLQRNVESIAIEEFANLSQRNSPHMIFELMGFGKSVDAFNGKARESHLLRAFSPSLG